MITIQWFGRSLFWKFSVFFATDLFRLVLVTWESVSATSSSYLTLDIIHLIHYPLQELLAVVCFLFWLTSYQACSEQLSKEILVGTCCRRESLLGIMGQLLNNTLGLQGTVEVFLNLGTLNSSAATSCWVPECVNWWTYSLSLGLFSKAMSCICPIRGWWPPRRQYFRSGRNWCGSRYSTLRFCGDSCSSSAGPVTVLSSRISTVFSFCVLVGYLQIVVVHKIHQNIDCLVVNVCLIETVTEKPSISWNFSKTLYFWKTVSRITLVLWHALQTSCYRWQTS